MKLTIIIPSFNRGAFIAQALDSIFMQESSYEYEIIIADDASDDNTLEIAKSYKDKYGKITILESNINQKLYLNVRRAYSIIKTEYFCILDPDDYWIDKHKIQKALDFLENNKDYTIYTGNTMLVTSNQNPLPKPLYIQYDKQKTCTFNDCLNAMYVGGHTSSAIFRNVVFNSGQNGGLPNKLIHLEHPTCERSFRGDTFRNVVHLHEGKSFYSCEVDSAYRLHDDGIWTSMQMFKQTISGAIFLRDIWQYYDKQYFELLLQSYKTYKSAMNVSNMHALLVEKQDFSLWMDMLKDLAQSYEPYIDTIDSALEEFLKKRMKPMTLKYRIFSKIHKALEEKLENKGFLIKI